MLCLIKGIVRAGRVPVFILGVLVVLLSTGQMRDVCSATAADPFRLFWAVLSAGLFAVTITGTFIGQLQQLYHETFGYHWCRIVRRLRFYAVPFAIGHVLGVMTLFLVVDALLPTTLFASLTRLLLWIGLFCLFGLCWTIPGDTWVLCVPVLKIRWLGVLTLVLLCFVPLNPRLFVGIGTLATLLFLLSLWIVIGTKFLAASDKTGIPIVGATICLGALFTVKGCNNNHFLQPLQTVDKNQSPVESIESHFDRWIKSRPQNEFIGQPYPVFVVCAEGGGIRAAITTFLTLARIQQAYPNFRDHLYAISSVSGGSVGAGVYIACNATQPKDIETTGISILSSDLLSPVVGALLGPELIQKILPFPVSAFDRTRILERSLEERFEDVTGHQYFKEGFREFWRRWPSAPLLFANLTNVETGARAIIAPAYVSSDNAINIFSHHPDIDFPFSTSVILSARFPFISSAGYLMREHKVSFQSIRRRFHLYLARTFVDGGYVDNSGAETLTSVLRALASHIRSKPDASVRFYVIQIPFQKRRDSFKTDLQKIYEERDTAVDVRPDVGASDLMTPITALETSSSARAQSAVAALRQFLATDSQLFYPDILDFQFTTILQLQPLGWSLSKNAIDELKLQAPRTRFKPQPIQVEIPTKSLSMVLNDALLRLSGVDDKEIDEMMRKISRDLENKDFHAWKDMGLAEHNVEIADKIGVFLCPVKATGVIAHHERVAVNEALTIIRNGSRFDEKRYLPDALRALEGAPLPRSPAIIMQIKYLQEEIHALFGG